MDYGTYKGQTVALLEQQDAEGETVENGVFSVVRYLSGPDTGQRRTVLTNKITPEDSPIAFLYDEEPLPPVGGQELDDLIYDTNEDRRK